MDALVTGGSGFFGAKLVERLRQAGRRVRVLDLLDSPDRPADVELVQGDIRDADLVGRACAGVEVVYHAVAQVPLAKDPRLLRSVNLDGTRTLLQAALRQRARKVVHLSSSAVFGIPERNPVGENDVPRPREAYGEAKLAAEQAAAPFVQEGLDVTIVRPRTILGRGRAGIFSLLFELVASGAKIPVLGRGDNLYQFVHADDLAEACLRAAARAGPATYHIGTDRFGTMRELLEGLIRHAGGASRVVSLPFGPAAFLMKWTSRAGLSPLADYHALMYGREMHFDLSKPVRELDWRPRFGNDEMIRESYDGYLRERGRPDAAASAHRRAPAPGLLRLLKWL
jgi:nucleoside-diphosphate-sugar epimerase